jgi:hypothetical protein
MMGKFGMKTIWSDLDGSNSSTSSLEIMPIGMIIASKDLDVSP